MATHKRLIKENVAPQGAAAIGVFQTVDGVRTLVGKKTLSNTPLAHEYGTKLLSIGLFSDIHMTTGNANYPNGEAKFRKAITFCGTQGAKIIAVNGDIAVSQTPDDYSIYKSVREHFEKSVNGGFTFYTNTGNHDMGYSAAWGSGTDGFVTTEEQWKNYTGQDSVNTAETIFTSESKNVYFAFLPLKQWMRNGYYKSDVEWLDGKLSGHTNDIVFAFIHMPIADRCGDWGYGYDSRSVIRGSEGYNNDSTIASVADVKALIDKYPNVIWLFGHTHSAWEMQGVSGTIPTELDSLVADNTISTTQRNAGKGDNYDANVYPCNGAKTSAIGWHLHLPSNCVARYDNIADKYSCQFAIADIYSDCVIIKGCSFEDENSDIEFLPIAHYKLSFGDVSGGNAGSDTGSSDSGSGSTTRSYIDETNKIIYGYKGESLDLGFTPEVLTRQDYSVFGASSTDTSVANRASVSGSQMTFKGTADKNWSSGLSGSVDGLTSSATETECWFWTFKKYQHTGESDIKYKTIIKI